MLTITKKDLIERISASTGQTRAHVKDVIQSFLDSIGAELAKGNRLEFRDFGVFEIKQRASRIAQNPKEPKQKVFVPPRRTVKFKAGRTMKKSLQLPDSQSRPAPQASPSPNRPAVPQAAPLP